MSTESQKKGTGAQKKERSKATPKATRAVHPGSPHMEFRVYGDIARAPEEHHLSPVNSFLDCFW